MTGTAEPTSGATVSTAEGPHPGATEAKPAELGAAPDVHDDASAHPTPLKYIGVAAILAAVTAIEVGIYYVDLNNGLMVAVLMALALTKFIFVAAYFMHLKFDNRVLRRFFITGIVLTLAVYFVVLISLDMLFG